MSTPVQDLAAAVEKSTMVFRKGEVVTERQVGQFAVVTIDAFPEKPEGVNAVDVHFLWVIGQEAYTPEHLRDLLDAALAHAAGEFTDVDLKVMQEGPSYITLGAWLGSQELALRLIGLGALLDWWDAITPAMLGFTGETADLAAGQGLVMPGGLRPRG